MTGMAEVPRPEPGDRERIRDTSRPDRPHDHVGGERPEAVLLDAGGVFLQPDAELLLELVHRFGSTVRTAEELDRAHYSAANEADTGDDVRYRAVWARHLGVPEAMRDQLFDALRSQVDGWWWVRPVPGAVAALRDIVASGVRTAIVSNADGFVADLLRTAGVCQEGPGPLTPVDAIVDSTVVGVAKPDPRIFQIALERLGGVPPERAVHVGDTAFADVRGARAAGVEPVHLDPYGDCRYPAGDHRHVRSLAEVVKMFL